MTLRIIVKENQELTAMEMSDVDITAIVQMRGTFANVIKTSTMLLERISTSATIIMVLIALVTSSMVWTSGARRTESSTTKIKRTKLDNEFSRISEEFIRLFYR